MKNQKRVATIILNRNLPKVTDKLVSHLKKYNGKYSDFFVLESGSDKKNLSKNYTWWANEPSIKKNGLRFFRGMNYALRKLYDENKFHKYDAFFLLTNDSEFEKKPLIKKLLEHLDNDEKLGLISPCSKKWGEKKVIPKNGIKYFWFLYDNVLFIRRKFMEEIINLSKPGFKNFLFDGSNFRGYGLESELVAKAYINHWAAAITSSVWREENEKHLLNYSHLIKTDNFDKNLDLYIDEGKKWMKRKYGFSSKWSMNMYTKTFYDKFFEYYPDKIKFKV